MTERHFESEAELRAFVVEVAGEYRADADEWGEYEAATALYKVLFELESDYHGHPYYISGNALFNAVAGDVDAATRQSLQASHGVFVPGEYGRYPGPHSQSGYAGRLGSSLPEVEAYEDLFLYRDPAHRWLLDSRPRDLHNTYDLNSHGAG